MNRQRCLSPLSLVRLTACSLAAMSLSVAAQSPAVTYPEWVERATGADQSVQQVGYCDCGQPGCDLGCGGVADGCGDCGDRGCNDTDCYGGYCDPCGDCGRGGCAGGCCLSEQLGDPYRIFGNCGNFSIGGWTQLGYHNQNNILFNNRKNELQLQQAWLYAEKTLDTSGGFDWGGRIDYVYGTDGPNTQAFGINEKDHWDNGWDNGSPVNGYGHAIPQLYVEAGFGNFTAKAGHFYTIIGYEVVPAPDNFFYSHAYTMNFSEPFTHTGALFTYKKSEDVEIYGGWVLGWDSAFRDNGDAYLGGSKIQVTDDIVVTSTGTYGRFNKNPNGDYNGDERGYMHSTVAQVQLCEDWEYVFQNDILDTEDASGQTVRDTWGINQYLIWSICDRVACGARVEWWHVEGDSRGFYQNNFPGTLNDDFDIYAATIGMNIRPCSNVVIRPEFRWDWVDGNLNALNAIGFPVLEDNNDDQKTFAIDSIILF